MSENGQHGDRFDRRSFLEKSISLGVAVGVHAFIASFHPEVREYVKDLYNSFERGVNKEDRESSVKQLEKKLRFTLEKIAEKGELDKAFGLFYNSLEYIKEGISESDFEDNKKANEAEIKKIKKIYKEDKILALDELLIDQGRYDPEFALLTNVNQDKKGDCKARMRHILSVLPRVDTNIKTKLQKFKHHFRVLVNVDGTWYGMDDKLEEITPEELDGSVLADTDILIKNYLGSAKPSDVRLVLPTDRKMPPTKKRSSTPKDNAIFTTDIPGPEPLIEFNNGSIESESESSYQKRVQLHKKRKTTRKPIEIISVKEIYANVHDGVVVPREQQAEEWQKVRVTPGEVIDAKMTGKYNLVDREYSLDANSVKNADQKNRLSIIRMHERNNSYRPIIKKIELDLTPLKGVALTELVIGKMNTYIAADLKPLAGAPLKKIRLINTHAINIDRFRTCPLTTFEIKDNIIPDTANYVLRNLIGGRMIERNEVWNEVKNKGERWDSPDRLLKLKLKGTIELTDKNVDVRRAGELYIYPNTMIPHFDPTSY